MDLQTPPELQFYSETHYPLKSEKKCEILQDQVDIVSLTQDNEQLKIELTENERILRRLYYEYSQTKNDLKYTIEKLRLVYDKLNLKFEEETILMRIFNQRFDLFEMKEDLEYSSSEEGDQKDQDSTARSKNSKIFLKSKFSFCKSSETKKKHATFIDPPEKTIEEKEESQQLEEVDINRNITIIENQESTEKSALDTFDIEYKEPLRGYNSMKINNNDNNNMNSPQIKSLKKANTQAHTQTVIGDHFDHKDNESPIKYKKSHDDQELDQTNESPEIKIKNHRHTISRRMGVGSPNEESETKYMSDLGKSIVALNYKPRVSKNTLTKYKTFQEKHENAVNDIAALGSGVNIRLVPVRNCNLKGKTVPEITLNTNNNEEIVNEKPEEEKKNNSCSFAKTLFEDFFIIGIDKDDLTKAKVDANEKISNFTLLPKILYNFNKEKKPEECPIRRILPDYCFPFGLQIEKIDIGNSLSFSSVYKVMYQTNYLEYRDKSFIMTLSSDETYKMDVEVPELLNQTNPNKLLHCICVVTHDYIESTDLKQKKNKKKRKFWLCPKVYCFMTYYPLVRFFFDFLVEITNNLKLYRIEIAQNQEILEKSKAFLFDVDSDLMIKLTQEQIHPTLFELFSQKLPKINDILSIKLKRIESNTISYQIPCSVTLEYQEALWGATLCFSNLPFEDFLFLVYASMLERKIVFLSNSLSLLTSTILTYFYILKPLKWIHPILCSLTESLLDFLGSPVPIIAGINKDIIFLNENKLVSTYPDCIFYVLDENQLYYPENEISHILEIFPSFNHFKTNLRNKAYKHFNRVLSTVFQSSSPKRKWKELKVKFSNSSNVYFKKSLNYSPNEEDEKKAFEVFSMFNKVISKIYSKLPEKCIFRDEEKTVIDYDLINNIIIDFSDKKDRKFLSEFLNTQNSIYYMENLYLA